MENPRNKKNYRITSSSHISPASWKMSNIRKHNAKDHDHINSGYHEMAIEESATRDVRASSNSSLSLSIFSESDLAEAPSTSGCSSEMASVMHSKQRKKEKAKEFMKKLKSMLPIKERNVKMDTLSTLEQVVNNMKRLSESQSKDGEFSSPHIYSGTYHSLDADKLLQSDMFITVSLKNHIVQTASQSLMTHLGYPVDWWKGRLLRDFLSKKDINTVNGCLAHFSKEDQEITKITGENTTTVSNPSVHNKDGSKYFFARIRRFRKLSEGFSIQNVSYSPFVMTVTMSKFDSVLSSSSSEEKDCRSGGRGKPSLVVYCHPLTSAYTDVNILPAERQFSLRHSPSCKYTDVEPSAIPLLGHLPQDFNGKSIFDLYHPEDCQKLLEIHKKIQCMGKPFKTDSIRLKTRNGCFIELETEWSSFTNPWTTRLEFIIGQHTVVKGPSRPDVFEDVPFTLTTETKELSNELRKTQEKIMEVLQMPVQDVFTQPAPRLPVKDQVSAQKRTISQMDAGSNRVKTTKDKPKVYLQVQDKGEKYTVLDEKGISSIYNQLNYSYNIKRFLLSHPKPFSNVSDEDSTPEREDSEDDPMHAAEEMPLELPVVKPSSCGSSTQVHVSEQGHGEEMMSPSAFDDEAVGQSAVVFPHKEVTADNIRVLTEESLKKHTKIQELLYLQKIAEEQPLLLNMRRIKRCQNSPQKRPWPREPDEEVDKAKYPCTNSGIFRSSSNIFMQSFPTVTTCDLSTTRITNPTPEQLFHQSRITIPFTGQGVIAASQSQYMSTSPIVSTPAIPLVAVSPSVGPLVPTPMQAIATPGRIRGPQPFVTGMLPQNIQWPFYPQPGYTLLPQVMGGFYRPILQPLTAEPSHHPTDNVATKADSDTQANNTGLTQRDMFLQPTKKVKNSEFAVTRQEADPMISSGDDTGSSIMYLLDADTSTMFEDSDSKKGTVLEKSGGMSSSSRPKNLRCAEPPWLRGIKWNTTTKMRYQMPKMRLKPTLKKEEMMLKKCQQGGVALESLEQLLEDISIPSNDKCFVEETDYLIFPKDEAMANEDRHLMEDEFLQVEMTMSSLMEERDDGGGGGGEGCKKKDTDNVIWEVRELESAEEWQQEETTASTAAAIICDEEKVSINVTEASTSSLVTEGNKKQKEEIRSLLEQDNTPRNGNKTSGTEKPGIEIAEVYMPTAQVEELNKRPGSCKEDSVSGDEGSDSANKHETEDSQSNFSKLSSDITPSDERSNEEVGSSHKESNSSVQHMKLHSPSSSTGQGSLEEEEEGMEGLGGIDGAENFEDFFKTLFVPLRVLVSQKPENSSPSTIPFWLAQAQMTPKVSMTYQLPTRVLEDVLQEDMKRLDLLRQSRTTKQQLLHLLTESHSIKVTSPPSQVVPKSQPCTSSSSREVLPSSSHLTQEPTTVTSNGAQNMETGMAPVAETNIPETSPTVKGSSDICVTHKIMPQEHSNSVSKSPTHKVSQQSLPSSHISKSQQFADQKEGVSSDTNSDPVVGDSIPNSSASSSSTSVANLEKQTPSSSSPSFISPSLAEKPNIDSFFHDCFCAMKSDPNTLPGTSIEDLIIDKVFVSDTGMINRAEKHPSCT